jgi:internalin A
VTRDELLRLIDEAAADGRPKLDLAGEGLNELPPEIGKLTRLKTLVLGRWDRKRSEGLGNNLTDLPREVGLLTELRSLYLSSNQLSTMPEIIGELTGLRALYLRNNNLSTLPETIGHLTRLRSLYLRSNNLSTLPEIVGQLTSLRSLDLRNNNLSTLPETIGQLTSLRSLYLGSNNLSTLPEIIGQLTSLRSLSLSDNQLNTLPKVIGQLISLRSLSLRFNQLSTLPEIIGQLTSLRSLSLSDNQLSLVPEIIGQLTSLRMLNLSDNQLDMLPEIVGQLSKLRSLDLSYNELSTFPEIVGQLTSLRSLFLGFNQLNSLPEIVGRLTSLRSLSLNYNPLTSLPEVVGQLSNLRTLSLNNIHITSLPEVVGQLSNLQSLDLNSNKLTYLPKGVGQMRNLQMLYLNSNKLTSLPEVVGQLSNLQSLDLSNNKLSNLPGSVGQMSKLRSLDLRNNELSSLPESVGQLVETIERLDLRGNRLPIPPEILGPKEKYTNPSPASETVGFYFSLQTEEGVIPVYEAKLILVGEGGAGKTTLAKKIDNDDYQLTKDEKSTEGIDVIRWDFTMADGDTFRTNIWDFGGQEIYHATHQFFLTKRSLYLLVADTRQENTDFYYWLKIIELLSDNSPVIIIKNEKQDRQCEIDEGYFRSQFNNLKESFSANLADNRGLNKIKEAIRYHISQLSHVGNHLPKNWVRVRAALENCSQNCNTITIEQYCDICRQNGFTGRQQMLILSSYLHDIGVCLHFQDDLLLQRTVILKPEWATTAVYEVADSDIVRKNKGRFTQSDITNIWSDSEYSNLRPELLNLMMRFKLAYELPSQPGNYIAPQLLPISQPDYDWDNTNNLILRYRYDFMPKGIVTRFIVETHQLIENQDHVWKNGVVLTDKGSRAQIIENYPKNEIHVSVSGIQRKTLLERVRYELWKIHYSYERLEYKELIPCNCKQCKGSPELEFYSYDLLTKYTRDRRYDIECRASYEKVDVRRLMDDIGDLNNLIVKNRDQGNIINQHGLEDNIARDKVIRDKIGTQIFNHVPYTAPSAASSSTTAQIFLSYARQDGTEAAKRLRQELIDSGFQVWRDIENMQGGKELKEQLRDALRQVDVLLVLLTPQSVISDYVIWECEIARALKKKIIPVFILECDIPDELQRLHRRDLSIAESYTTGLLSIIKDLNQLK